MPILKAVNSRASLMCALEYIKKKAALTVGISCRPESALDEMKSTQSYYGKTKGRGYFHYVLSFAPDNNITAEKCAEIAQEVIKANPSLKGHEALIAVHTDVDHIHAHMIFNSVSLSNGKKLHVTNKQYRKWIEEQQRICNEHGYSPVLKKETKGDFRSDNRTKYETVKRKGREADIVRLYEAINHARKTACNIQEFVSELQKYNIETEYKKTRKHIVFSYNNRKYRDTNISKSFTDNITMENLENEFFNNRKRQEYEYEQRRRINREIEQRERSINSIVPRSDATSQKSRKRRYGRTRER